MYKQKILFYPLLLISLLNGYHSALSGQCVTGSAGGNPNLQFDAGTGEYSLACDQGNVSITGSSNWTSSSNIIWTGSLSGTGNQTFVPDCNNLGQFNFIPCLPAGVSVGAQSFPVPSANLTIPPGGSSTIPFDVSGICWQSGATFSGGLPISISPNSGNIVIIVDQPDGSQINSGSLPVSTVNSLSPVDLSLLGLNTDPNGHWDISFQNPNGATMTVVIGSFNINMAGFTTSGLVCGDPVIVNVYGGCPDFVSAQSSKPQICSGESFQLSATLSPAGAPNVTYTWSGPGISGTSSSPTPIITGLTNTTCDPIIRDYTLSLTCTNDGSSVVSNHHILITQYPFVDPAQILIDNTTNVLDPDCSVTVSYPPCPSFTVNGIAGSDTQNFTSGDNGTTASFVVSSGGNCAVTVNPTVTCLSSCTLATYLASSYCNADGTWSITIDITDMGDSQIFDLIPSTGSPITIIAPVSGIIFGPYASGEPVNIKLINPANPGCNQNLGNFSETCLFCPSITGTGNNAFSVCSGDFVTLITTVDQGVIDVDYSLQWYIDGIPAPGGNTNPYNLLALADSRCAASVYTITVEINCLIKGIEGVNTLDYGTVMAYPVPEYGIDFIAEQCSAVLIDNCGGTLSISNGGAAAPAPGSTTTVNYTAAIVGAPSACTASGSVVIGCPLCTENPGVATATAQEVCWGEDFSISSINSLVVRQGFEVGLAVSSQPIVNVTNTADLLAKADIAILGPYASPGSINPAEIFTNNGGVLPAPNVACGEVYYFTPFVSFSDITSANSTFNFPSTYVTVPAMDIDILNPANSVPGIYSGNVIISGLAWCEGLSNYTITLCVRDRNCDGCDLFADPATVLGIELANTGAGITSPFPNINYGLGNHGSHGDGMDGSCITDPTPCTIGSEGNYVQSGWTSDPNETINLLAVNACFAGGFFPVGIDSDFSYQATATMTNTGSFNFPTVCPSCNSVGQSVAVKILPQATITSITPPPAICAGESLDLSSLNPTVSSTATGQYEWSDAGGIPLPSTLVSLTTSTQYCVTYKFCESQACNTNTQCITVPVNSLPILFQPSLPPVCPGESVDFTASEPQITTASGSFEWYIGNPQINGALLADPTSVIPLGSELYCAVFTSSTTGCADQICFPANYNSLPILFAVAPLLCAGDVLDLANYESDLNPDPGTFIWYDADPLMGGVVISNTVIASYADGDDFWMTFTDASTGCSNTSSIVITVNMPPVISTPAPAPICPGTEVNLTDNEAAVSGASGSFVWYDGDPAGGAVALTPDIDGNIFVTPTASDTYWVSFTDATTQCTTTTSFAYTLLPIPSPTDPSPVTYCADSGPYDLTAIEASISSGNSFIWYDGDPAAGGTEITTPTAENISNGTTTTYWYVVTNSDLCSTTGSVDIQIYAPVSGATASYDCTNNLLVVDLSTATGGSGTGYAVDVSSANQDGEVLPEGSGFSVIVTDDAGCLQSEITGTVNCISDCFADIGTVIAPPATLCEGEQLASNSIPADYIPSNADPALSAYYFVVTWDHDNDPLTDNVIEGFSPDGSYDFSTMPVGTQRCFTAFTYDQGWVDELTCNPANAGLLGALGITCGATLPEIFANPLVASQIGDASIGDALAGLSTLCGLVTCPASPLCYDYSLTPYCVEVVSCGCTSPSGFATANCSPTPVPGEYYIDVYINDFGTGNTSYTLSNSATSQTVNITGVGSFELGPLTYVDGTQVVSVTVSGNDEPGCVVQYNVLEKDCTCPAVAGHFTGVSDIACLADMPVPVNLSMPIDAEYPNATTMVYDIIVTNPNDDDGGTAPDGKIIGFTELDTDYYMTADGTATGTPLALGDTRCFYGVIYDQAVVDQFIILNPLIGSVLGVSVGDDLPTILNAVLNNALVSDQLPAKDVPSLLLGLPALCGTTPIPGVTINCPPEGLCLDFTRPPHCVTVTDCSASCTAPTATFAAVCNTGNTSGFFVNINTTNMGSGNTSYTVSNSLNTTTSVITATGTTQVGPFANNATVTITLTGVQDASCTVSSTSLTADCTAPVCTAPTATFATVCNTGNTSGFFVNINTTNMGSGNTSYTVSNSLNATTSVISATGTTQVGPFANNASVTITLTGVQDASCTVSSTALSSTCVIPCIAPSVTFTPQCNGTSSFSVAVNINGGNGSYTITNSLNGSSANAQPGLNVVGPFLNGQSVVITVHHSGGSSCNVVSSALTLDCLPPGCENGNPGVLYSFILCNQEGGDFYPTASLYEVHTGNPDDGNYSISGATINDNIINAIGSAPGTYSLSYTVINPDLPDGTICPDNTVSTDFTIIDCSITAPDISISDPCSCDTYNAATGMFGEEITITGPPGQEWTLMTGLSVGLYDASGMPLGAVQASETALNSGIYILNFYTMDGQGFLAYFSNSFGLSNQSIGSDGCSSDDCGVQPCGTVNAGTLSNISLCNMAGGVYNTSINLATLLSNEATGGGSFTSTVGTISNGVLSVTGAIPGNYSVTYTVINPDIDGQNCADAAVSSTVSVLNCSAQCIAPSVNFTATCINDEEFIINTAISGGNGSYLISNSANSSIVNAQAGSNVVGPFANGTNVVVTVAYIGNSDCDVSSASLTSNCSTISASLSSIVFIDANADGLMNNGETGLAGVLVTLISPTGALHTTITDGNGSFAFTGLTPGAGYMLNFQLPSAYTFTIQGATGGLVNSDANPITGNTIAFTLYQGYNVTGIAAGVIADDVCNGFYANIDVDCNDNLQDFMLLVGLSGGNPGNGGYLVSSDIGTNGIVSGSFSDGPFLNEGNNGYNYEISVANHPECSISLSIDRIECIYTSVELLAFQGEVMSEGNLLTWSTGSEENNDYFRLERSTDGIHFQQVATIESQENSQTRKDYAFLDKEAPDGQSYYRLIIVSLDGESENSSIVKLERRNLAFSDILIAPNPALDYIEISYFCPLLGKTTYSLLDISGRKLIGGEWADDKGINVRGLHLSSLSSGSYFLLISNGTQNQTARFIKE